MTIDDLFQHLQRDGYGHLVRRTAQGLSVLDMELERDASGFRICIRERGQVLELLFETGDEAQACAWYLDQLSIWPLHLTTSEDEAVVVRQQAVLEAAGITVQRNDIPNFNGPGDVRFRLFVPGADLKRSQTLLKLA